MSNQIPHWIAQRVCIWFCLKNSEPAKIAFNKMKLAFGRNVYSYRNVCRWYKQFQNGRQKLSDNWRGERRRARTQLKQNLCEDLVHCNRRASIHYLSRHLGISYGSVHTMLHKDLEFDKKSAKMVPHLLTDFDRRRRLEFAHGFLQQYAADPWCLNWVMSTDESWFHVYDPFSNIESKHWLRKGEDRPQIPRCEQSVKKVLVVPFFDSKGLVHLELPENQTVNQYVFHGMLRRCRFSIRVHRGTRIWHNQWEYILHMDNAPAHRSNLVQNYLRQHQWSQLVHPPYSPDLSPADFFLFPRLKRKLRGVHHGTTRHLQELILDEIGLVTQQEWRDCFTDWIRRCRQCVIFGGNYFEGMIHPPRA